MGKRVTGRHEDSSIEYILGKTKVVFNNGQVATRDEFDRWIAGGSLLQELKRLEKRKDRNGWDYRHAVETGELRKLPAPQPEPAAEAPRPQAKEAAKASAKRGKGAAERRRISSAGLAEAAMLLVGLGGGVMSAYHTSAFLIESGKPAWTGLTTGVVMIMFSTTAFTLARLLANKLSFLIAAVGASVVAFSMFSTVAVNFNQFKWKDERAAEAAAGEALETRRRLLELNREELLAAEGEISRLDAAAEYWKDKSWARHDSFAAQAAEERRRQRELAADRRALESAAPELAERAAASGAGTTVYAFIGGLFRAREELLRFIVYVIPSCFYDLAAPLALSVVFLMEDRRRGQAKKAAER
jgi:hypothetical protein